MCEQLLDVSQPVFVRRGALGALLRLDSAGAEERILNLIRGDEAALKPVAIAAISDLPSPDASKKFGQELPRLRPEEQVWLIEALASRDDAPARAVLREALSTEDATVRRAAITAVGSVDNGSAVPLLAETLTKARTAAERRKIEFALASLKGGPETDQAILAELKKSSLDSKRVLISTLVRRQSHAAVPALLDEAGGPDPAVAAVAFGALGKLVAADDLPALLKALANLDAAEVRPEAESAVTEALLKVDRPAFRSDAVFGVLVRTADAAARGSLLRLLPACGDARAFAALKVAREDPDPGLRETAVRALAEWPNSLAWETLAEIYRQPARESHRVLALRALVRLMGDDNAHPDAALMDRYRQLFAGAQSNGDRKLILGALAGAAHPDALQLVLPLLTNAEVRAEAALAVKKIAESIQDQYPQAAQAALEKLK